MVLNRKLLLVCLATAALVALVESGSLLSKLGVIPLCLIFAPAADLKRIHYAKYKTNRPSGIR